MRVLQSTCDCNVRPKLIFVGTHKDLEYECTLIENRQVKNQKLRKIIPPGVKDSIIYCDESLKELLIAVNVKTPGDDDKKVIGDIREMMVKELQRLPKRRIPLRYFALEMAFLRLGKYQHKAVLSKEECFKEATAYHFTKESFDAALKYLHSLKLIFYYEEVLPDVVIIDAQVLLDKITELVEYSLSLQSTHVHKIPVTGNLEELKAYGIISQELLSYFRSHYVHNLFTEKELILLFKYLRVIAEVYQGKYLMPCLLRVDSRPILLSASTVIPPLLFYFGPDGPKLGIYCFLLASLITDAKWELMSEYDHPVQLSRNRVQFVLPGENPGCITITDSFSTFFHISITFPDDITYTDASKICEDICPKIRETILTGIRNASLKLNYSHCECAPKLAFLCIKHLPTDEHPATVSLSSALLTCTAQRASVCCKLTEHHRLWLGKVQGESQIESLDEAIGSSSKQLDAMPTLGKLAVLHTPEGKKINVIKKVTPKWQTLGDQLEFDESGSELELIKVKHPNDPQACCRSMFQHWLKGNGVRPCSWNTLIELLKDCDLDMLADEIRAVLSFK